MSVSATARLRFVEATETLGLDAAIRGLLEAQGFAGEPGQRAVVTDGEVTVYLGLGTGPDREGVRRAVASIGLPAGTVVDWHITRPELVRPLACELSDAGYPMAGQLTEDDRDWAEAEATALQRARQWTNAPAQEMTPERLADEAWEVARAQGLTITVLDDAELRAAGFGAILAVGQGSAHPPRLVDLRYEPQDVVKRVTLVGKGITFDTGGLSLKSPAAMASMRMDKVGAATVLGVLSVLPRLGLPIGVRGLLPLAENMIGPQAIRPGDVVIGRSGLPITIVDTDFEGRVLMSDSLTYAAEEPTDVIVDIAALTYQVAIALGNEIGGFFASDDALADQWAAAGREAGEAWWRLPLAQRYLPQVRCGDGVKNHPESDVGRAITAALFLQQFVPADVPWAHLDITGPAWSGPASSPGATGFATRTLLSWLRALAG